MHAMSNDARKHALKKAWKEQEHQKLVASIPMSHQHLRDLFDHLDREGAPQCDHTLRETIEFSRSADSTLRALFRGFESMPMNTCEAG